MSPTFQLRLLSGAVSVSPSDHRIIFTGLKFFGDKKSARASDYSMG